MKIAVIGTGYVGLVSGVMLSSLGFDTVCVDLDRNKIDKLNSGILPIYEPGLEEYFADASKQGKIKFTTDYSATKDADIVFIAVGTPPLPQGIADVSLVHEAVLQVIKHNLNNKLIVIKSTVPPTTSLQIADKLLKNNTQLMLATNPEFLREGSAVEDFLSPDRIIIGVNNDVAKEILYNIYKPIIEKGSLFIATDYTTSEMIKYASNAFLATKIAFINEMSDICDKVGADIDVLSYGIGSDQRIGKEFLKAGPGFGGSCFPKDLLALSSLSVQVEAPSLLLDAVINTNTQRTTVLFHKIEQILQGVKGKKFAILGLSYKANTDDIRASPAVAIARLLKQNGASITSYDPVAITEVNKPLLSDLEPKSEVYEVFIDADCIIIATEWQEFYDLDFKKISTLTRQNIIIDLRSLLKTNEEVTALFRYYRLGKLILKTS